jgi:DNA-binding NtrC family response regulator
MPSNEPRGRLPVVLLVQHDVGRRTAYAEALEQWGFRVLQAETAQLGLRAAWDTPPDVIAVDVAGLGLEAGRFFRGLWGVPSTSRIPLVRFCEKGPETAVEPPSEATVELVPGCLPEQLLAAIQQLLAPDRGRPDGLNGVTAPLRLPKIDPPYPKPKSDRRRDGR